MTLEATHYAVCDGCRALGPAASTRVLAWTAAQEAGWTLTRATSEHWCPRCTGAEETRAADERDVVHAVITADGLAPYDPAQPVSVSNFPETRALRGGIRWPQAGDVQSATADPARALADVEDAIALHRAGQYPSTIFHS